MGRSRQYLGRVKSMSSGPSADSSTSHEPVPKDGIAVRKEVRLEVRDRDRSLLQWTKVEDATRTGDKDSRAEQPA